MRWLGRCCFDGAVIHGMRTNIILGDLEALVGQHLSFKIVKQFMALSKLAPRGAWLRQKSCQEISCSRSGGIKEVSFV
jgi:hypothetical protein